MRTRVNNSEVYHLWANEAQSFASSNNCSFNGDSANSYGACIGRIVRNEKGEKAYLVSNRSYSVTTSGHQSMLRRAIPPGFPVFCVNCVTDGTDTILRNMMERIPVLADKAKRARSNKPYILQELSEQVNSIKKFAEFFSLSTPFISDDIKTTISNCKEALYRIEQERIRKAQEAEERREREAKESIEKWINGEDVYIGYGWKYAYLRVKGDTVQTTFGAMVPLDHVQKSAKYVLVLIEKAKSTQEEQYPTKEIRFGHYKLNGVTKNGEVIVGCHFFREDEIKRFARVIGIGEE